MSAVDGESTNPPIPWYKLPWIKRLVHLAVLGITVVLVGQHVIQAANELRHQEFRINVGWVALASLGYLVGFAIQGIPWFLVNRDWDLPVPFLRSERAYLVSHVGKYVPGKMMVIVIRYGLVSSLGIGFGTVFMTTLFETFITMASGSSAAIVCLLALPTPEGFAGAFSSHPWLILGIMGMCAGFLGVITPWGYQFFSKIVTAPFKDARVLADRRIRVATVLGAFAVGLVAWSVMGLSYLATLNAVLPEPLGLEAWPMTITCVALSIVVGFLSMIPGQAGVRELILIEALKPVVGNLGAVAASLLFRVLTLFVEAGLAAVLYLGGRR
ncbi:hypothetical protein Pan216_52760 [Planctomycetes bacterium Pan216]|uniref:Flippase-like domain-containing protein n=1 Tax=Kolteria novifilia TaxID=2527975 RepID=A0A518BBL6_9BACT|nr:hypothetical protein Pan216_52760 [Planctomycetes bacterium Pan216]